MTDETLHGLAYMFQQILEIADIQIVNVHLGDQHFVLTVWQVVASALFFAIVVKFFEWQLTEGKGGCSDD